MNTKVPLRWTVVVVLAGAAGAALRLNAASTESLWYDEVAQAQWNDQPFWAFLGERWDQVDPPLNEIVMWCYNNALRAMAPAFAKTELALRLPVILLGLSTIPAIALAVRSACGGFAGALAAWLFAAMPFAVRYGQEARMYSLTMALAAWALFFLVKTLQSTDPAAARKPAALFGLCTALAAYSHYYALLSACAAGFVGGLCWLRTRDPRCRAMLGGVLLCLGLVAPYLLAQALHAMASGQGTRPWLSGMGRPTVELVARSAQAFVVDLLPAGMAAAPGGSAALSSAWSPPVAIAGFVILLVSGLVVFARGRTSRLGWIVAGMVVLPPLAVLAVSFARPIFHARYLLFIFPPMLLLAAAARPGWLAALAAAPVLWVGLVEAPRYHKYTEKPDYRGAAEVLLREFRAGDAVDACLIDQLPLAYYVRMLAPLRAEVLAAVRDANVYRSAGPHPGSPDYRPRTPASPGCGVFEVDAVAPMSTIYTLDAARVMIDRKQITNIPRSHRLLFESAPAPSLRLWRRDS
jgi:hypothetical protein